MQSAAIEMISTWTEATNYSTIQLQYNKFTSRLSFVC